MHDCINIDAHVLILKENTMRTTITIDDALYQQALELSDPDMPKTLLVQEAIKTFVRIQAGKRLAALGGSQPDMREIPRHHDRDREAAELA
jgi:Arc/MetJ family transcription regulator